MARLGSGSVYEITALPQPFDTKDGRINAGPVYGLRGCRKRKRHEIAVGVDGEAVNILNIQTQSVVASYALPPQSYLLGSPKSIYTRIPDTNTVQRRTLVVLRTGKKSRKQTLVCFSEQFDHKNGAVDNARPAKKELSLRVDEVVSVEIIQSEHSSATACVAGILVNYKSGAVDCVSEDMTSVLWREDGNTSKSVEFATLFDSSTARRGILAGREDVMALLNGHSGTGARTAQLLCNIAQQDGHLCLNLYKVRVPSPDSLQSSRPGLDLIMATNLPCPIGNASSQAVCDLNAVMGRLYRLENGRLTIFDLSNTSPRLLSHHGSQRLRISSFSRLSTNLVAAVIGERVVLYETRYGSIQESLSLEEQSTAQGHPQTPHEPRTSSFIAVCGYADLNVIVGMSGTELKAVQFSGSFSELRRYKAEASLLSDVAGKGVASEALRLTSQDSNTKAFGKWKEELDKALADSDVPGLEKIVAETLCMKSRIDDDAWDELDAHSFVTISIDRRRVLYLLANSIKAQQSGIGALQKTVAVPSIPSADIYKWLALTGFLSPAYLNQAMAGQTKENALSTNLTHGDIMSVISHYDTGLQLLYEMLALPIHWAVEEVVEALKTIAQSFEVSQDGEGLALPPPSVSDDAQDSVMADADIDTMIESESRAAEQEVTHAESTLSHGLEIRSAALQLSLARLHAFPSSAVSRAMRARMDYQEIIFFINVLRIELANGNWTRRYVDVSDDLINTESTTTNGDHMDPDKPIVANNRAICAIADMLNCAVDAVGTSGWLVGLSGDSLGTQELVNAIRAEVSAGLEACYEADLMHTFLNEIERYEAIAPQDVLQGAQQGGFEKGVMPIGGRVEAPFIRSRDAKLGDRKRSYKVRKERMMKAGKYSFDRIRV